VGRIKWKGESSGVEKQKWLHMEWKEIKPRGDDGECIKMKIMKEKWIMRTSTIEQECLKV